MNGKNVYNLESQTSFFFVFSTNNHTDLNIWPQKRKRKNYKKEKKRNYYNWDYGCSIASVVKRFRSQVYHNYSH